MLKTYLDDIRVALSLLTRLPIRVPTDAYQRSHKAVWAYGAAGAVWAICVWAVATLAMTFGLSTLIAAGLGLTMGVVVTGAMHEDGLADCADGFWGGWEPERRLDIMRDSRLGVYGSLALILSTLLRWNLIATILADANSLLAL
jgi:adenosylcobinamide-GDP ribazoletransferase